jgi:hypothetical protein
MGLAARATEREWLVHNVVGQCRNAASESSITNPVEASHPCSGGELALEVRKCRQISMALTDWSWLMDERRQAHFAMHCIRQVLSSV